MRRWQELAGCESAQATVEYMVLLAVVVALFLSVAKVLRPKIQEIWNRLGGWFDQLFSPSRIHNGPFHLPAPGGR